jgi:hypothetical protein
MKANCDMIASIAEEHDLIPTIAETGLDDGYQTINSSMWYYSEFTKAITHGNCKCPPARRSPLGPQVAHARPNCLLPRAVHPVQVLGVARP